MEKEKQDRVCAIKKLFIFQELYLGDGIYRSEKVSTLNDEGEPRKKVARSQKYSTTKSKVK